MYIFHIFERKDKKRDVHFSPVLKKCQKIQEGVPNCIYCEITEFYLGRVLSGPTEFYLVQYLTRLNQWKPS